MMGVLWVAASGLGLLAVLACAPESEKPDQRGIALQTVIITVVLIVIAGGVSAALLARGGEAVEELESQSLTVAASNFGNEVLCVQAGYEWDENNDTCGGTRQPGQGRVLRTPGSYTTLSDCHNASPSYRWHPTGATAGTCRLTTTMTVAAINGVAGFTPDAAFCTRHGHNFSSGPPPVCAA